MATIRIRTRELNSAISSAWKTTMREFDGALKTAIREPLYDYPRVTVRRSGEVVGSPRNIVDTGELLRSQSRRIRSSDAEWQWSAEHALIAHEGATFGSGAVIPPRRWTRTAYQQVYDIEQNYARNLEKLL